MPQPRIRSGFRKIIIDGSLWQYKIGRGSIVIFSPTNERHISWLSDLLELTPMDFERLHWKNRGTDHAGNVKPHHIERHIRNRGR